MINSDSYKYLMIESAGGIATVTMNRPDVLNAVNLDLHLELERVWGELAEDEDIGAIILTGAGTAFSAGGDIKATAARAGTDYGREYALKVVGRTLKLFNAIVDVPQPVIAAVNGDAIGLGATLAFFADVSVVAQTAKIGDTHTRVGMVAGDGGAVIWPLLIGPNRAKDMLMRGKVFSGIEAERLGLANYTVPAADVMPAAIKIAEEILQRPRWAVRWTKLSVNKMIKQQMNLILDTSIAYEALTMLTHDHAETARAIIEKRKPALKGS